MAPFWVSPILGCISVYTPPEAKEISKKPLAPSVLSCMNLIRSLAFFLATAVVAMAAPQQAINPDTLKDKVSITLGQEFHLKFKQEGDQLL
jgi:hypothetical protein